MTEDRVPCCTPAEGRDGVTNIPKWKFDLLRRAILDVLQAGDIKWMDLTNSVRARISEDNLSRMGKLGWHVVTVKLDLEVRGEIERRDIKGRKVLALPE